MFVVMNIHVTILILIYRKIGKNKTRGIAEQSNLLTLMLSDIRLIDVEVPAYCD